MAEIKLAFVDSFIDVRGKRRHMFRRKGCRKITINGRPGSAEFMRHYAELLAQSENAIAHVGTSRTQPGTLDALIVRYLDHDTFKGLAEATQATRRRILNNFRQYVTPGGYRYGANSLKGMQRKNITDVLAGKSPTVQGDWMKALRHLMAFAVAEGECKIDPTIGIEIAKPAKSDGHLTWGDVQIAQYRDRHAIGSMARLALEMALNIAARRHDVPLIGRQHLRNGCIAWRPRKTAKTTAKVLTVPILPELQAALDAMSRSDALTFLLTEYGRPFKSAAAFGNKFAAWCEAAGLKPVVCDDGKVRNYRIHGLRKAACTQLAHAGCTAPEIMAVSGHITLSEAQKYITDVEQYRMAVAAMTKRAAGSKRAQPVPNGDKSNA